LWFSRSKDGVLLWRGEVFSARSDDQGRFDFEPTESEWQVTAAAPRDESSFGPGTIRYVTGGASDLVLQCTTLRTDGAKLDCEVVDAVSGTRIPVRSATLKDADQLDLNLVATR